MININAIVCADNNWGIGYDGNLLVRIPEDMKMFKQLTTNRIVVMGRKTFDSLPNKKPLPNRLNVVLTSDISFSPIYDDVKVCYSQRELIEYLSTLDNDDIYVIGGSAIYSILLPYCKSAYITRVWDDYIADTYFRLPYYMSLSSLQSTTLTKDGTWYSFCIYENDSPLPLM